MKSRINLIRRIGRRGLTAIAVCAGLVPYGSFGQTPDPIADDVENRTTTVLGRDRPELKPQGVRISGFVLTPSLGVGEVFDDNVFAKQANTKSDLITTITPAVRISSDWNQHHLSFNGSGNIVRYADNSSEDHETFDLSVDGRIDVSRDTKLTASAAYEVGSEERGSVDDVGGQTPTQFDVSSVATGIVSRFNRLSVSAGGEFSRHDYDDVVATAGTVNNDDRDRDELKFTLRAGYQIQDEYEAFTQVILTSVDYDAAADDNGLNRDGEGYEIRAGARVDITALLFGDIFVGYLNRDYDGATLRSVDTIVGGLDLTWNVTPLTTITGGVERGIDETTLATASGSLRTNYDLSVDHELLRNLILSAWAGVSTDDFEGTNRNDDYARAGLGAKYLLNRNFSLAFSYEYSERDSSVSGSDYEINRVFLRLEAHL